ncbi:MAG TPA: hypothetical protein DC034_01005 [Clostridium sp.]|jgi:hypothetical protein|uniref:Uncharacterized protein n=1 Tax=Clostridium lapidicellarium TaxID=3240931 RepID=A0ABV4E131_9CLOT|nr:hypothetical protein [uncultured Clostridium sp.]NLU08994.1 hypothetical protein [Clostridiales bacterium]HBC95360.1 hypothetical protein [Clostridium sp.]
MSRHHRSHSRRHPSNITTGINDESYYIDDERSSSDYDPVDIDENHEENREIGSNNCNSIRSLNFIDNLKKYIGNKVTVYTTGGNSCGYNFTGTLLGVNKYFIRLEEEPSKQPRIITDDPYSLANNCNLESDSCSENTDKNTLVDIPIDKIAAFLRGNI